MAKDGIDAGAMNPLLAEVAGSCGWALCVGAGISVPVFPSWNQLVEALVLEVVPGAEGADLAASLLSRYSADSLIEASKDRLGMDEAAFADRLASLLYAPLFRLLTVDEKKVLATAFSRSAPNALSAWREFGPIRERVFSPLSASALADCVADAIGAGLAPASILSFNAEPLLFALINHSLAVRAAYSSGKGPASAPLKQSLDLVTHSISFRRPTRIPYVFCHGLLPVPEATGSTPLPSVDKLVFSESQYLHLAQSAFSFQASAFLEAASTRKVLFVGVSLSDPNMRRWLSWTHSLRVDELRSLARAKTSPSSMHLWLRPRPRTSEEALWVEASVAHLGVRVVWMDDWSQVGPAVRRMLGLPDQSFSRLHNMPGWFHTA